MTEDTQQLLYSSLLSADELKRLGRYFEALELLRQAVARRFTALAVKGVTFTTPTPIDLLALENLADLSVLFAQTEAADDLLVGIGLWFEQAGNRYYADYFAVKRAHLAIDAGRLTDGYGILQGMESSLGNLEAIDFSEAGMNFWEQQVGWRDTEPLDRAILFSQLYLEMGRVLAGFGQYRESLAAIERGLQHASRVTPEAGASAALHLKIARATALIERGDFAQARTRLDELQPMLYDRRRPGLYVRCLELKGKLHLLTGEFGNALELFRSALHTCRESGFDRAALIAGLNLGHVLIYLNQTSVARDILTGVARRAGQLDDRTVQARAQFLLQVARARGHSLAETVPIAPSVSESWGVINDATPEPTAASRLDPFDLPQSDDYLSFFEDRALGFHWHLGRRDFEAAETYLSEITQVFELSDSELIHLRLQTMRGMLAYYRNELRQAGIIFIELRDLLRARGLKPELWQVLRFLSWCWAQLGGQAGKARDELETETQQLLDEMTSSLPREDQAIFLLNKWTENEEFLASEIHGLASLKARMKDGSVMLRPWRRWRLMQRLHNLLWAIDRHKDALARKSLSGEGPQAGTESAPPLWKRLLSHPRDRATLSFLVLPDQVFLAQAGWLTLDFGVSPVTRLQVRDLVRRWHELIRTLLENNRGMGALHQQNQPAEGEPQGEGLPTLSGLAAEGRLVANHLARALQIPDVLDSLPERVCALTIVPDDSLHGFPFAAITYKDKYLIEQYALSLAFESLSRDHKIDSGVRPEALAVGVSRGIDQIVPEFSGPIPSLPGAPAELHRVKKWFANHHHNVLQLDDSSPGGEPANKARLCELLPRASLFHIACHGFFRPDAPDQSGLVLLPNSTQAEILSLRELSELDLGKLRHATLSSCWSADHFILPGRWVISLPETIWRAGAQSVLGCLWVVNDDLAVDFMERFYNFLDEHPRDEALQRAQLDFLRNEERSSLYYWAGYSLYGAPSMLGE